MKLWAIAAAAALVLPQAGAAQLAADIAAVDDGTVRFEYETRPEVEICAQGIRIGERHMWWHSRGDGDRARDCRFGPAEVELRLRDGVVRNVEVIRDVDHRTARAVDLGLVAPREAAQYLLSLAYEGAGSDAAEDAILPAMLADAGEIWRELLDIARDRRVHEGVRKSSLFWLGQEAAEAATAGLADVALDSEEDQEIRNSAIFALSQRPADEGVPILMEVARDGEEAETRRTAMFWLAQSGDERVVDFFEDILLRRNR